VSGPARPLLLAAGGIAALCAMDAVVKHLQLSHAVLLVVFIRYVTGSIVAGLVWALAGRPRLVRAMWRGHLARGATIAATAFLFYWSLTVLTLAEAVTLSFTAPLLIPLLAWAMLGERLRRANVIAGLAGFGGVLIAVGGGTLAFDGRYLGVAAILGASVTYALTNVLMRARGGDGSTLLTLTGALIPALLLLPLVPLVGADAFVRAASDTANWPYFIASGVIGNIGIQLLSRAYARAEAQVLAPVEFTALPWAALLGWACFDEAVSAQVVAGGTVIIAAGLWSARPAGLKPPRWVAP